jgi:hypothetical protein
VWPNASWRPFTAATIAMPALQSFGRVPKRGHPFGGIQQASIVAF